MSIAQDSRTKGAKSQNLTQPGICWSRVFTTVGIFVALGILMAGYYLQNYSGLTTRDQMDIAQIARNIESGGGYTTHFVRPLNVRLMSDVPAPLPEINHGPLYPYAVAVAFRIIGVSDQVIVWMSMMFCFLMLVATFLLGKMLFDWRTGIFAAAVTGISVFVLQAATGASEWPMAACWFVLLMLVIAAHHKNLLAGGSRAGYFYTAASAVLIGMLYMTHQVLLFLFIPVALYFAVTGPRRTQHLVLFVLMTVLAAAPWAYRNAGLAGGSVLGANAWDIMADTQDYPGSSLYRTATTVNNNVIGPLLFPMDHFSSFSHKLLSGTSSAGSELVSILGLIILPLGVVSILYRFKSPSANAIRGLIYVTAPVLLVCIALFSLGSEALMLLAPCVAVFGSAYFFLLLDAKKLHPVFCKGIIIGVVIITGWSSLSQIIWTNHDTNESLREASVILSQGDNLNIECIYTDVPWIAAWRNLHMNGVWLPKSDQDIEKLGLDGFKMHTIVLTNESRSLPIDEIWYKLFTSKLQRDYIADPDKVLDSIRAFGEEHGRSAEQASDIKSFFNQSQRNLEVFDTIRGFKQADLGPYASDNIQVFEGGSEQ